MISTTQPFGDTLVTRASQAFAAFQSGDRASFDSLVEMATPLLWHTVRSQGVSLVAAEDVLQTVWLNLLRSAPSVRDPQTIVKWLLTSARREAWRMAQKEHTAAARTSSGLAGDELAELPVPPDAQPEAVILRNRRQQQLWRHVQRMAPKCRELLRVIAFADRPNYGLIAQSLEMPVGSIGPTRGRCLAKLRDQLARDPEWEA